MKNHKPDKRGAGYVSATAKLTIYHQIPKLFAARHYRLSRLFHLKSLGYILHSCIL